MNMLEKYQIQWTEILESAPPATNYFSCFQITENTLSRWVPMFCNGNDDLQSQTLTVVS